MQHSRRCRFGARRVNACPGSPESRSVSSRHRDEWQLPFWRAQAQPASSRVGRGMVTRWEASRRPFDARWGQAVRGASGSGSGAARQYQYRAKWGATPNTPSRNVDNQHPSGMTPKICISGNMAPPLIGHLGRPSYSRARVRTAQPRPGGCYKWYRRPLLARSRPPPPCLGGYRGGGVKWIQGCVKPKSARQPNPKSSAPTIVTNSNTAVKVCP